MKKWLLKSTDDGFTDFLRQTQLPPILAKLLYARGICSADAAQSFFNGEELSDPFLIKDMEKAVEVITNSIQYDEKITVYGDYDCDGVTSTVMLYSYLEAIGAAVEWYIPTREEGYGLNKAAVYNIAKGGTKLIITVDNGISAIEEADYIYELGMRLVITDHHRPPLQLPRCEAAIDLHRPDDASPFKELAGCGVTLKLISALENDADAIMEQYSTLAAIGTIGDVVPLYGENRTIVKNGIKELPYSDNIGLLQLIKTAGVDIDAITAGAIAFGLCPRINAAGRYGSPAVAAELFLTQSEAAAKTKAEQLCSLNSTRKQAEEEILAAAMQQLQKNHRLINSRVLVVSGEGWHHGVIGIVCARLLEIFEKPCIVIGIENNEARGSARSIEGFSMYAALEACSEVLTRYGGHPKAGGFSLPADKIGEFTRLMEEYAKTQHPSMPALCIEADIQPDAQDLDTDSVEKLKYLEPCGEENPTPLFMLCDCKIISKKSLKDGKYVSFNALYKGKEFKVLCFNTKYNDFAYDIGDSVDILVNAGINEYNGKKNTILKLKDIRLCGFDQEKYLAARHVYEKILLGESVEPKLAKIIIPDRENMKIPFDIVRRCRRISAGAEAAQLKGVNYCLYMMCLHVFEEFGYVKLDRAADTVEFIGGTARINPEQSAVVSRIKKSCGVN